MQIKVEKPPVVAESPTQIFHAPCAFNQKGVPRKLCQATTRVLQQNVRGCCGSSERGVEPCTSPERVCKACLLEGGEPNKVKNIQKGLCEFHEKNGVEVRRPKFKAAVYVAPVVPPPPPPKVVVTPESEASLQRTLAAEAAPVLRPVRIAREKKMEALRKASTLLGGKNLIQRRLAAKAAELLAKENIPATVDLIYNFLNVSVTPDEKKNLGIVLQQPIWR